MSNEPGIHERVARAGHELYEAVCAGLTDHRGIHLETAIAASGYLAGTAILRSTGVNISSLAPGAPVFVDTVNELGPKVVGVMMDLVAEGEAKGSADLKAPPVETVPPNHRALRSREDLMALLWPKFDAIVTKHEIPPGLAAFACTHSAARLIIAGQDQLSPAISKALAVQSIVSASKTVPPKFAEFSGAAQPGRNDFAHRHPILTGVICFGAVGICALISRHC